MNERIFRKTFPADTRNNGPVSHQPDRPSFQQIEWEELGSKVISNGKSRRLSDGRFNVSGIIIDSNRYSPAVRGQMVTPVTRDPLTPVFHVGHGGGRFYGGGTSGEALHRAKRKARLNGSR